MGSFLWDAGAATVVAGAVTASLTMLVRLLFRRGKGLEEP
jgi:hypothetical protein